MLLQSRPSFLSITVRTIVTHTVTYFLMGLLALVLLNYRDFFTREGLAGYMRPVDSLWVTAGPLVQPLRGLLFGVVFTLLRDVLFGRRAGWLVMWLLLVIVGIFNTFGPAPGSIEGFVYTLLPWQTHLTALPEILLQTLLLSTILVYWVKHPQKRWLNWLMGIAFFLVLLFPTLGLLLGS